GIVRVYDARTGQEILALKGPAPLGKATFSPDGARLAVGPAAKGGDGMVRVYDVRTGQGVVELSLLPGPQRRQEIPYKHYYGQEAYTLRAPIGVHSRPVFTRDGTRLAAVGNDHVVRVYDARTGQEQLSLQAPAGLGLATFSSDGTRLAVGPARENKDGVVRVYDARTGREVLTLKGPAGLGPPVFRPDGAQIAVAPASGEDKGKRRGDGVVRVYDARTGQEQLALTAPLGLTSHPAFSPDGTRLAATAFGGGVSVYNTRTGREEVVLKGRA